MVLKLVDHQRIVREILVEEVVALEQRELGRELGREFISGICALQVAEVAEEEWHTEASPRLLFGSGVQDFRRYLSSMVR